MKQCSSCDINVDSPIQNCPLCYTTLRPVDSNPSELQYPIISSEIEKYQLAIRILAFVSFALMAVSVTINILTPVKFKWSLIVVICVTYVWWAFSNAIRKHARLGYNLMIQLISLAIVLYIFSKVFSFETVFFTYILPAMAGSALLCFDIVALVQRKDFKNLFVHFLAIALLNFLPIILLAFGKVAVAWPAACCAVYSIISIVGILIFGYNTTKDELQKRFHL